MLQDLQSKLKKMKIKGLTATACCPCHDDTEPSLSLKDDGGKLIVHCHAKCNPTDILKYLGYYQDKGLIPTNIPSKMHAQVNILNLSENHWFYSDLKGNILFLVERKDLKDGKKKISPYSCYENKQGEKIYKNNLRNLDDRPLLYLQETIKHKNIIIVEGEKTCDAANRLIQKEKLKDFFATTWSFGTNSVNKTDFKTLFKKNVYLLPDNDQSGKSAMREVANLLDGSNKIKMLHSYENKPKGFDIADEENINLAVLLKKTRSIKKIEDKFKVFRMDELMNKNFSSAKFLVQDYVSEGFTMFIGKPKVGKSWFLLQLAYSIANGDAFFDKSVDVGDVLYFSLEDNGRRLKERLQILGYNKCPNLHFVFNCPKFDEKEKGKEFLLNELEKLKNPKLIIIDTLQKVLSQKLEFKNSNAYEKQYNQFGEIKDFVQEHGISIIGSGHQKKRQEDDIFDTVNGSMAIQGSTDQLMIITKSTKNQSFFRLRTIGRDVLEQDLTLEKNPKNMRFKSLGSTDLYEDSERSANIRKVLEETKKAMKPSEIDAYINGEASKKETNLINQCLQRLEAKYIVTHPNFGIYKISDNPGQKPKEEEMPF